MHSPRSITRLIVIIGCLFSVGVSCTQAEEEEKKPATSSSSMSSMMNPMMMNQMNGMVNPHMYMNMMGQMSGMMNPHMFMNMMNPMMMGGGAMNPMMGMNMMYPMMGMMGPMSGGMGMPGMGTNSSNPMSQMPGTQMMDPKQYEQWFNQWTEMMKNMAAQQQGAQ